MSFLIRGWRTSGGRIGAAALLALALAGCEEPKDESAAPVARQPVYNYEEPTPPPTRPDDVAEWKEPDFLSAADAEDSKLGQAIDYVVKRNRDKAPDALATLIVKVLKKPEVVATESSNSYGYSSPSGNRNQDYDAPPFESVLADAIKTLGSLDSDRARSALTELVRGRIPTRLSDYATVQAALQAMPQQFAAHQATILTCLTQPEAVWDPPATPEPEAAPANAGNDPYGGGYGASPGGGYGAAAGGYEDPYGEETTMSADTLYQLALDVVRNAAPASFRTKLAEVAAVDQRGGVVGLLLEQNPDNAAAQMALFESPRINPGIKAQIEERFLAQSSSALASLMGLRSGAARGDGDDAERLGGFAGGEYGAPGAAAGYGEAPYGAANNAAAAGGGYGAAAGGYGSGAGGGDSGAALAVLRSRCFSCHGPRKQEGGLRLDDRASAMAGGDSGAAISPGAAASSLVMQRVEASDPEERMPPQRGPLSASEIASLRDWINSGANWGSGGAVGGSDMNPRQAAEVATLLWRGKAAEAVLAKTQAAVSAAGVVENPRDLLLAAATPTPEIWSVLETALVDAGEDADELVRDMGAYRDAMSSPGLYAVMKTLVKDEAPPRRARRSRNDEPSYEEEEPEEPPLKREILELLFDRFSGASRAADAASMPFELREGSRVVEESHLDWGDGSDPRLPGVRLAPLVVHYYLVEATGSYNQIAGTHRRHLGLGRDDIDRDGDVAWLDKFVIVRETNRLRSLDIKMYPTGTDLEANSGFGVQDAYQTGARRGQFEEEDDHRRENPDNVEKDFTLQILVIETPRPPDPDEPEAASVGVGVRR